MRTRRRLRAIVATTTMLAALGPTAEAGRACASYQVQSPVHNGSNTVCSPVQDPLPSSITSKHCFGIPPASTQGCGTVVVPVP